MLQRGWVAALSVGVVVVVACQLLIAGAIASTGATSGGSLWGEGRGKAAPVQRGGEAPYKFVSSYDAEGGKAPVRWSRCSALTIVVEETNAPANSKSAVTRAAEKLQDATGLTVNVRYVPNLKDEVMSYGDIPLTWVQTATDKCESDDAIACARFFQEQLPSGAVRIANAEVFVYRDSEALVYNEDSDVLYLTLLHEFGHAVGLDHVKNENELMYARVGGADGYSDGDLAGLRVAGKGVC